MICPAIISNSSLPDALLERLWEYMSALTPLFWRDTRKALWAIAKADRQLKQKASVTNTLSALNKSTLKEASDMKGLLHSMTAASIAAGVAVLSSNPVVASDRQTPDSGQNTTGNEPSVVAQKAEDEARGSTTAKVNLDSQGVILKGCDVVAYFRQRRPVKGDPAIKSLYQGATYLFASAANKADFDKDPAKYVPQYGGFCSYAVVKGVLADLEGPDAFTIYKGKLYLGGNEDALRSFKSDIDSNIDKANSNWRRITGN